jgi:hypothetical protein
VSGDGGGPLHPFRAAHARGGDWHRALHACLGQLDPVPEGANLGFVYLGEALCPFTDSIVEALRRATGLEHWIGAGGQAALGLLTPEQGRGGMSVLIGRLPERSVRFLPPATALPSGIRGTAAILHASGETGTLSRSIRREAEGAEPFLIGSASTLGGGLPQIAGSVAEGVIAGVVLERGVAVLPLVTRSCAPLGGPTTITSRVGQEIFRLAGRPALDVLLERCGDLARARPNRLLEEVVVGEVVGAAREARPVGRLIGIDARRRSLTLDRFELPGPEISLMRRDAATAERDLHRALAEVRAQLGKRAVSAVIYFSSVHRLERTAAAGIDEIGVLHEALGGPPLVGLSTDAVILEDRLEVSAAVAAVFV